MFSVPTSKHATYQIKNAIWHFRVWVLHQKLDPMPKLYETDTLRVAGKGASEKLVDQTGKFSTNKSAVPEKELQNNGVPYL